MNRILNLLRRSQDSNSSYPRKPFPKINNLGIQPASSTLFIEPQHLSYASGQSIGKHRDHNEDSVFSLSGAIGGAEINTSFGLFIVADGMGGHLYGEVASLTATRTIAGSVLTKFHLILNNPSLEKDEQYQEIIRSAIQEAQLVVSSTAPGSGTTLTAALVVGHQLIIGHVGDSRAYFVFSEGRMEVITRDHSLVKRLEELGQISSDEALTHPQRNVLYRAVGQDDILEVDIQTISFPSQAYLLICSDGLWGVVPEEKVINILFTSPNLHDACQKMIDAANDAGGPDNISVILVHNFGS